MAFDVLKVLEQEGYIKDGEDNLIHAEKAFFAARVMKWISHKAQTETDFNLSSYLTLLMYYKTGMADLRFSKDGDKILYKMTNPDSEVQEIVDSLVKFLDKKPGKTSSEEGESCDKSESSDRDPEP